MASWFAAAGGVQFVALLRITRLPLQELNFVLAIMVWHVAVLLFGNYLAFRTRGIDTRFAEAKWVAACMVSTIQVLMLALPLLLIVGDDPSTRFIASIAVVFINDLSVLLFIFVPKVRADSAAQCEWVVGGHVDVGDLLQSTCTESGTLLVGTHRHVEYMARSASHC